MHNQEQGYRPEDENDGEMAEAAELLALLKHQVPNPPASQRSRRSKSRFSTSADFLHGDLYDVATQVCCNT